MSDATPILRDCDPGHDDAIALLLALASPELELLGVTTVAGNQTLEKTTANALHVLELVGRGDVDVAAVVRLLEAAGYRGWYVLEQDVVLEREPPAGDGPATAAARSVHFLTRVMRA